MWSPRPRAASTQWREPCELDARVCRAARRARRKRRRRARRGRSRARGGAASSETCSVRAPSCCSASAARSRASRSSLRAGMREASSTTSTRSVAKSVPAGSPSSRGTQHSSMPSGPAMIRVTGIRSSAWRVSGPSVSMYAASPSVLGNWPVFGDEAGRGLVAEDAVEERGHADRAADVGAEPDRRAARADRRALAAGGAAGGSVRVVGVAGAAVDAVDRLDPHRHLRRVRHAERDEAGLPEARDGGARRPRRGGP